jgi:CRISPR-associated protein Csd2
VEAACEGKEGYRSYVKERVPLERSNKGAFAYLGINDAEAKDIKKKDPDADLKLRDFMCKNFFDIRTFGAVMTTFTAAKLNCGQVRGPVQLGFARSIDPIMPQEVAISRLTVATENELESGKNIMLGRKFIVPYALYRVEGHISANLARKTTGFSEDDLELLWKAIINMFELDHSAARGNMAVRKLVVFKHESELGNAPAYQLFDCVNVQRRNLEIPARSYGDYEVNVEKKSMPNGITCIELV